MQQVARQVVALNRVFVVVGSLGGYFLCRGKAIKSLPCSKRARFLSRIVDRSIPCAKCSRCKCN